MAPCTYLKCDKLNMGIKHRRWLVLFINEGLEKYLILFRYISGIFVRIFLYNSQAIIDILGAILIFSNL